MDRRYGKLALFVVASVTVWNLCYGQNPAVNAGQINNGLPSQVKLTDNSIQSAGGFFSKLFNMHKIRPMRQYSVYGNSQHNGPYQVEEYLPPIILPKDTVSPEMIQEIYRRNAAGQPSVEYENEGEQQASSGSSFWSMFSFGRR